MSEKKIVHKIEDGMDPHDVLCTTYQMRNFYMQFHDGFFQNLDVMNYIQHFRAAQIAKKGDVVVDVCCGRSLMLPLLRYYAKDIKGYIGIDICEANIKEAKRGCIKKNLMTDEDIKNYYPFKVKWIQDNVANMDKRIKNGIADFVIYTSAIEHMHKDVGSRSLEACYNIMHKGSKMFLSCPNTPGNGYDTQYAAHVYEWGYDELKEELKRLNFKIVQEVGLVMGAKDMNEFFSSNEVSDEIREFYQIMKAYVPNHFLTAIMSIPYPKNSKEILFIVEK